MRGKPFKKGHKGYKPKGAVSKKTKMWDMLGQYIVEEGSKKALAYLDTLEGKEFFDSYGNILEYFKPKQSRMESNVDGDINVNITREILDGD